MDAFDDAFGAEEVDPAAEFLAKEQEELADLGEDLGFAAPPAQVGSQGADPPPPPQSSWLRSRRNWPTWGRLWALLPPPPR